MQSLVFQLDKIKSPRILVLGDLILDRYTFGNAERVSPEAPVLVLRAGAQEVRLGGAASVAFLLRALGAHVTLAGVVGNNFPGRTLQKLVQEAGIDGRLVAIDPFRPTTTKERFVGRTADRSERSGHQILRVDTETRDPISRELEAQFTTDLMECLFNHDALLISDYAKGVCTHRLLATVIAGARMADIPSLVDPAGTGDFGRYHRATVVKPNRLEAELATGRKIRTPQDAFVAGRRLCRQHEFGATLITLDQEGMALVEDDDSEELFPTHPREVYDVTGAGDMVLAALGLCQAGDLSLADSIRIANVAAGLELEKLGVAPVTRDELRAALIKATEAGNAEIQSHKSQIRNPTKLLPLAALIDLANEYRASRKTVVFTNGCFDLLHAGHVACLTEAAALGDVLIVAINSDASVRAMKGEGRPVVGERDRAAMIAALERVDNVILFDDPTPHKLLEQLRPDVLVKGGTTGEITGHEIVESYGGRAVRVAEAPNVSTTSIIARIRDRPRGQRPEVRGQEVQPASAHSLNPESEIPNSKSIP